MSKEQEEAQKLMSLGYRVTSRKHTTLSRVDKSDWKEVMAKSHCPYDIEEGRAWVNVLSEREAEDFYRRVISKDRVKVSEETMKLIENSNSAITGYIEVKK
jgi:hypothetical protein